MSSYINLQTKEGRAKFYKSNVWKMIREIVLRANPYCVMCLKDGHTTYATCVDHIVDIVDAPHRVQDRSNLQGLCTPCHASKTFGKSGAVYVKPTVVNNKWGVLNEIINATKL